MKNLFTKLVNTLKEKRLTISCAESCTGGLIAKYITDISGASSVFNGGVVSYVNQVKMDVLGVSSSTIDSYTEVSYECAKEMAFGVKKLLSTDIGISTTGFAGPGGGTDKDPVGTVYVGIAIGDSCESLRLSLGCNLSREEIRDMACYKLISLLLEKI
ncbi:MAG: CinA family protein [Clostridia bacterium]|nr:CinA family protein [Clostridia bacterium]